MRHMCEDPQHGVGNNREMVRTQGTSSQTGPWPRQPAGLQGPPLVNRQEIKNANIPGSLLQRNKNTSKFKEAPGALVKAGGFPQQGALSHQTLFRGQSGPRCPLPGWWGIVPTTQRQHNMGDQNPCSGRPCLKNGRATSVSCMFNFIRCYLRIGTNTGMTCWNLQGADGGRGEPGSVRKEPASLKTSHHICAGSQDFICVIIMQK